MEFRIDHESGYWIAETIIDGFDVQLRLETEDESTTEANLTGRNVLEHVKQSWQIIKETLVDDLLPTHNDHWADPANSRPKLSENEFLTKLVPISIEYGSWEQDGKTKELYSVMFEDSNIFGGHAIDVIWHPSDQKIRPSTDIVG